MTFNEIAAAALAVLLVSAGAVAAVPGDVPDGAQADDHSQADEHAQDGDGQDGDRDERARGGHANASVDGADDDAGAPGEATAGQAREERGPPTDVPEQVPDFVSPIHEEILKHLNGDISGAELGEVISNLTPGDGSDGGEPTPAPTPTPAGG